MKVNYEPPPQEVLAVMGVDSLWGVFPLVVCWIMQPEKPQNQEAELGLQLGRLFLHVSRSAVACAVASQREPDVFY